MPPRFWLEIAPPVIYLVGGSALSLEEPPDKRDEKGGAPGAVEPSDVPAQTGGGGVAREKGVEG